MRWAETRWGGPATALTAILAGAAALRAVGIQYGLPYDNLLNPDEHNFVVRAWRMVHGGGADPKFFDYPTLLMYVEAPFQAWQGEPSLLAARIVVLVLSLGSPGGRSGVRARVRSRRRSSPSARCTSPIPANR